MRTERLTSLPHADGADAHALVALEQASQLRPLTLPVLLAETGDGPHATDGIVLVGRGTDGTVIGMTSGRHMVDELHVLRLVVDAAHRRRGFGRALLDRLVATAADDPALGAVVLEVRADNAAARALYTAAGFVADGRRLGYYPDGEDALLLRRPLDPRAATAAGDASEGGR